MKVNSENEIISKLHFQNDQLKQFNYIIAHNLKVPLANMIALSEEISDDTYSREEHKIFIQDLSRCVVQIQRILEDLNKVIHINENIQEQKEHVSLQQVVEDIKASVRFIILKKNATVTADFSVVPSLFTVRSYIYSICYNLIVNSLTYQKPEVSPVIRITSSKTNGGATQIIFADNGAGIDLKKNGNQVFGMYQRFTGTDKGKGLGLFMTKNQVEALGGKIEVQSEPGIGTTFTITF